MNGAMTITVSSEGQEIKARRLWPKDCIWQIGDERFTGTPTQVLARMLRKFKERADNDQLSTLMELPQVRQAIDERKPPEANNKTRRGLHYLLAVRAHQVAFDRTGTCAS
jgi:hypothetical protein